MSREITKDMLADVEWLNRQLKTMGAGFNKHITAEFVGRTVEFMRGVLWERERQNTLRTTTSLPQRDV